MHGLDQRELGAPSRDGLSLTLTDRLDSLSILQAPLLSKVATMSGFLRKQADNEPGKWTQYYFVLKPTTYLYYYNTKEDAEPRGIIDMEFLRDVRLNAECVERSVGGSPNGFRVTGRIQGPLSTDGERNANTYLRPVYLNVKSCADAEKWMDAIKHRRFDLTRHLAYESLVASMQVADERVMKLVGSAASHATFASSVLRKGREYLCKLRGVSSENEFHRKRTISSEDLNLESMLRSNSVLFDELFAQADSHRQVAELLRQREDQFLEGEARLRGCQVDLKVQLTRVDQLEREVERLQKARRNRREELEARYADLFARVQEMRRREKATLCHVQHRERVCNQRVRDAEQHMARLAQAVGTERYPSTREEQLRVPEVGRRHESERPAAPPPSEPDREKSLGNVEGFSPSCPDDVDDRRLQKADEDGKLAAVDVIVTTGSISQVIAPLHCRPRTSSSMKRVWLTTSQSPRCLYRPKLMILLKTHQSCIKLQARIQIPPPRLQLLTVTSLLHH